MNGFGTLFRAILLSKSHPFCPSYSWLNTKKGTSKTKKHPNVNFLSLHYVKSWLPLGGYPGKLCLAPEMSKPFANIKNRWLAIKLHRKSLICQFSHLV